MTIGRTLKWSVLLAAVPSICAAELGPKLPSALVHAFINVPVSCQNLSGGSLIDKMETQDGSSVAFAIPAGKVLVVTKVTVGARASAFPVGTEVSAFLAKDVPAAAVGFVNFLGVTNGVKLATFSEAYSPGIVVKSGTPVCLKVTADGTTDISFASGVDLYGYIAPDR
jgi:hypothetical protein